MAITLQKGGNISLTKTAPALKRVLVGLGWQARSTQGDDFDLDASAFLLGQNGKVRGDDDFIFYNQLTSACGAVEHTGDNRTGDEDDGDDESIIVDLTKVAAAIQRIVFSVTIHDAASRAQSFGQIGDAYMRLVDAENNIEIARFDLSEDYSTETAMIFGEIYLHNSEWKFKAVGQGYAGGLEAMCKQFGVVIA